MKRLSIPLTGEEIEALERLANTEKRSIRLQAALIVRLHLEQLELLPAQERPYTAATIAQQGQGGGRG